MGLLFFAILLICFFVFVLPLIQQYRLDNSTTGTIISVQTETYTGSYGRRYTRQIVAYEFEDFQGKIWRGKKGMINGGYFREGMQISVRYSTTRPYRNEADI
ncbi:MAG: DUF3592 domain-containing protein [Cyanobacteria bacterium P01_E01_bin.6]